MVTITGGVISRSKCAELADEIERKFNFASEKRGWLVALVRYNASLPFWRPENEQLRLVVTALRRLAEEPCPSCSQGGHNGLPGSACENCMNTGLKYPEIEIGE